ncbi:MAG: hypothetical protein ACE5E7_07510 [Anaerolineae bacterium]
MKRFLTLPAVLILVALACRLTGQDAPGTPTPSPILGDWFFKGCAFLDSNGNEKLDAADAPIENALFTMNINIGAGFGGRTDASGCTVVTIPGGSSEDIYPATAKMTEPDGSGYTLIGAAVRRLDYPDTRSDFLFSMSAASPSPATADFTITLGPPDGGTIRPLLGVNAGPMPAGTDPGNADLTEAYQTIGVTMIRTHDFYGPLDMATLYPDPMADPADPPSYDFADSDEQFAAILAGGFEPYLRLGNSYNNSQAPANPENWVRAAVEVVGHYRQMAAAAAIPLRYVEIWNEPDNRHFWDADRVAFFDLFAQTAQALKLAFPDLKVGGPGLTPAGFLAPQGQQYTQDFLEYMQSKDVPLDFFSWHVYSNDPNDFLNGSRFYREQLDAHGYTAAESHISEWNTQFKDPATDDISVRTGARGAAILSAAWIALQGESVDVSTFYRGNDPAMDAPHFFGMFYADGQPKPAALAFSLWAQLAAHPQRLSLSEAGGERSPLWNMAGQDARGNIAVLVANPTENHLSYALAGLPGEALIIRQISDPAAEIDTFPALAAAIEISPNTVQLVTSEP